MTRVVGLGWVGRKETEECWLRRYSPMVAAQT